MAIQYRGTGTSGNSGATSVTTQAITLPTGWAAGDLLFVVLQVSSSAVTGFSQSNPGTDGAWTIDFTGTQATPNLFYAFAHRRMAAGDVGPTFTWTTSSGDTWSCGGFRSDAGGVLSLDKFAAGDPLLVGTAATTATPNAVTAAGGGEASIILSAAKATAASTAGATVHTFTPSSGWTSSDGDGGFNSQPAGKARWSAHAYQLGVSGTVTPGAETLTDDGQTGPTSDLFFWTVAHAVVSEALPAGAGAARPGKTWLRRFHHRQQARQPVTLAAAAVTAPAPLTRPLITSRLPARARIGRLGLCAAGIASQVITPLGTPGPAWRPQPRRPAPARAVWHGAAAPQAIAQVITAYRRPGPQISRRLPADAVWRGGASGIVTPRGTPGPAWRAQPRRPGPARGQWHGNAAPQAIAQVITAYRRPGPQITSREPQRAVWRGNASGVVTPRGTPAPAWRPQPRRPAPARALWHGGAGLPAVAPQAYQKPLPQPRSAAPRRAVWHGNASRAVTPLGTTARRPGPQITSKPRTRAVWHGGAGTLPPSPSAAPPKWRRLPDRKGPQRAVLRRGIGLANALPPAFSVGVLTAATAATGTLTAASAPGGSGYGALYGPAYPGGAEVTLTAADKPAGTLTGGTAPGSTQATGTQRTGGPS